MEFKVGQAKLNSKGNGSGDTAWQRVQPASAKNDVIVYLSV